MWTPTGGSDGSHNPDGFLRLTANGGHPGRAANQIPGNSYARFAIAAYTVPQSGIFQVLQSYLQASAGGDGIELRVAINSKGPIIDAMVSSAGRFNFHTDLGYLAKCETGYVAGGSLDSVTS